jgi:hypothetical protein
MPLSPARVLRQFRYALYFDGVDDRVDLGSGLTLVTDFTVLVWVSIVTHRGSWTGVAGNTIWTDRNWWIILGPAGSYNIRVGVVFTGGSAGGFVDTPGAGTWVHVGLSKSGNVVKGYYNGVLRGTWAGSGDYKLDARVKVGVGARNGDGYAPSNVMVSQFQFYSRPLADSEILWNYNNPDNPIRNGLVLWLQAHPDYVKDIDGDGLLEWLDLSGYSNHGKIYGATIVKLIRDPVR